MRSFFIVFVTCLLFYVDPLLGGVVYTGSVTPGFAGSQFDYMYNNGFFLESNNSDFGFGFVREGSDTLVTLSIVHRNSRQLIWSANRASPVFSTDNLHFEDNGNVVLRRGDDGSEVWRLDNTGKNASRMELRDSGNLVVVSGDTTSIWESFDNPTDTLITNQVFREGMKLTSRPSPSNMTYALEIKSGDMFLSVNSLTPQVYWSLRDHTNYLFFKEGLVTSSSFLGNYWRFFDRKQVLLWEFRLLYKNDDNATWIGVLGTNGLISFSNLGTGSSALTKIPTWQCATPESCGSYYICSLGKMCLCVSGLSRVLNYECFMA